MTNATKEIMQRQLESTHKRILSLEAFLRANPSLSEDDRQPIEDRLDDLNDLFIIISNKL